MAESLPPESDTQRPNIDDEGFIQIGVHDAVFPPPEQDPPAADLAAAAAASEKTAEAKLSERDAMNTDPIEETTETPPATVPTADSQENGKRGGSCLTGCLHDVLLVLLSALLGGALVLAVLLFLNGTLDMKRHDAVVSLDSRTETLSDDLSSLNERVDANTQATEELGATLSETNEQLDTVDEQVQTGWSRFQELDAQVQTLDAQVQAVDAHVQTLDGRVQDLDQRTQTLDIKITTVREEVVVLDQAVARLSARSDEVEAKVAGIDQQMAGIEQTAERFDTFADGLRALADSLARPAPEAAPSATEPISSTEPVTVSITITTSETVTANAPPTSTLSLPLVGNQAVAAATADAEASSATSIADIATLTLFPPVVPIPDLTTGQSHILGLVWDDLDGDGQPEDGEVPLPAVTIILHDARGNALVRTVTDSAGRYLFANITPGVYIVEEIDPATVGSVSPNLVTVTAPAGSVIETNFADR
jgi:prefoldin subunit 5